MNKSRFPLILASAALLIGSSATAFATSACESAVDNLIVNCGFETGDFTSWTKVDTSNFSGVDAHNPYSGSYAASLGATGTIGSLSQTVTDVAGAYYGFSFALENEIALDANGIPYPGTNFFSATFTNAFGTTYVLTQANNIAESSFYSTYEVFFFGTGSDTITFNYENGPSYFDLDDVTLIDPPAPGSDVAATPEPSGLILMGTGILSIAGLTRRRFQRTSVSPAS